MRAARPARTAPLARTSGPASASRLERLQRPRLRFAKPRDGAGGAFAALFASTIARSPGSSWHLPAPARDGAGEIVRVLDPLPSDEQQPRARAHRARGHRGDLGRQQLGRRGAARPPGLGSRPARAGARRDRPIPAGVRRSACSASSHGLARAPRSSRVRGGAATVAASSSSGCSVGEREMQRTQLRVADHLREREVKLAPLPRPRALPRDRGQQRVRRAHTTPLEHQQPGVERSLHGSGARSQPPAQSMRRSALSATARSTGGPQRAAPPRASRAGPRPVRHRNVLADPAAARRSAKASAPAPARTAGCPASTSTTRRRSWPRQAQDRAARTAAGASRRYSAGRPRAELSAALEQRLLERRRATGTPSEQERQRALPQPARDERQRIGRRRHRATGRRRSRSAAARRAASARSPFKNPSAIACGSGGTPVGSARSSATSSAAR